MDNNTNSIQKLMTPEELRRKLLNINISFCNYINTFNHSFEDSPEPLNNAMKYSKVLTDEFTQFYQQFNILTEEALKEEVKQNQNQNQISSPKKIVIDNEPIFYTKGDANHDIDNYKITKDMIIGIVNVKIPYIGYPTVWVNEL